MTQTKRVTKNKQQRFKWPKNEQFPTQAYRHPTARTAWIQTSHSLTVSNEDVD